VAKPIKQRDKWRIRWFDENGIRRSEVFGDYRTAQQEQSRREAEVTEVREGLRAPRAPDRSFAELCDYWLAHRASRKRSQKDDESIIRAHLRPAFGRLQLRGLGIEQVDAFVATRDQQPKTIANILTLLVAMLNYARDLGWIHAVPRIRKPRVRLCQTDYRYLKTRDEIRRFLEAARLEGGMVFTLYATAVFTGMRAGELADLSWDCIDLERRIITVRGSFGGPTKNGMVRHVPVVDALLPTLRAWRLENPLTVVFPNRKGRAHGPSAAVFQEVLHRVLDRAGFPSVKMGRRASSYITFHGLRHTFASHWMVGGGDLFRLQRVMGHQSSAMTDRYSHLSPDVFAGDHGRFGENPLRSAEVIPLRRENDFPANVNCTAVRASVQKT